MLPDQLRAADWFRNAQEERRSPVSAGLRRDSPSSEAWNNERTLNDCFMWINLMTLKSLQRKGRRILTFLFVLRVWRGGRLLRLVWTLTGFNVQPPGLNARCLVRAELHSLIGSSMMCGFDGLWLTPGVLWESVRCDDVLDVSDADVHIYRMETLKKHETPAWRERAALAQLSS